MAEQIIAIDIETTGLIPSEGEILEVSLYVLSNTLDTLDHLHIILPFDNFDLMDDTVFNMHSENSLLYEPNNGTLNDIYKFLNKFEKIIFLGNSVNFDKSWIEYHIPEIKDKISYRIIDTRSFLRLYPKIKNDLPEQPTIHRSEPDVLYSIQVARQIYAALDYAFNR